jgi:ParB-like chromosome segregation protein Spo0J
MSIYKIKSLTDAIVLHLQDLPLPERVEALNAAREILHQASPFKSEPVDFVRWVSNDKVTANDYNPNSVAPPEMELLRTSIMADGYTQPIVGNEEDGRVVVVDGFHRHRVGKECADVQARIQGFLPVVQIRAERVEIGDRMASTIRHNRARGKHSVDAMSQIVVDLKRRNWSDEKISRELGMDADEVLRLTQISGLREMFADVEFSEAWEADGEDIGEEEFKGIEDDEALS